MLYHAEISARPDHLLIVSRGEFDVERGRALFTELIVRAKATDLVRIVADNRQLERPLASTEKVLFGASVESLYREYLLEGGRPLRVAFLVPEAWLLPYRPLADGLNSMGFEAESFADPERLAEWLGVSEI
jgi:hypothetical protein